MLPIKLVPIEDEIRLTERLCSELIKAGLNAENTTVVTVSTDYSAHIGMWLRHGLSKDGEIAEGFGIDVPYPDENWDERYRIEMDTLLRIYQPLKENLLLVEAGVIRGSNYGFVTDWIRKRYPNRIWTLALYENLHSMWKSDWVGEYFDSEREDLTFWWERPNRHWN